MKKRNSNKKAQTWSIDLVLGVIIFLLVIIIIYALLVSKPASNDQLRDDGDKIYSKLDSKSSGEDGVPNIVQGNSLSAEELENLYKEDYDTLKTKLGITNDFCIIVVTDNNEIINTAEGSSMGNGKDIEIGDNVYCGGE
ncbi:MAG: hypothetical protein ACP5N3_00195 [Candidatus Nanoarchaeia archaeon]